jgi:hypothetical protein
MRRAWLCLAVFALTGCGGSADVPRQEAAAPGALSADGIGIALPDGWAGRILIGASGRPVLHAASYPLEANDTDEGMVAQEAMGVNGMYLNIRDLGPGEADGSLPLRFEDSDFEAVPASVGPKRQAAEEVPSDGERFRVTAVSGGDSAPPQAYLVQLNDALSSLQLSPYTPRPAAAATGDSIGGFGLHANVPAGWEGGIARAEVHAGDASVDLAITEHSSPDAASFVTGHMPILIGPAEFVHPEGEGGGTGYETGRSFVEAGREFQLWVRSANGSPPVASLERVNALLASFHADPGDFYPGRVEPATFAPADGWLRGSSGAAKIQPDGEQTTSWASTVPYRDSSDQFPPHETLAALPPDGVLVVAWLQQFGAEHAPLEEPPFRLAEFTNGSFEGVPQQNATRMLHAGARNYGVTLWVFFGREHPTDEQLERAQAELDRLNLPDWPAWNATSAER